MADGLVEERDGELSRPRAPLTTALTDAGHAVLAEEAQRLAASFLAGGAAAARRGQGDGMNSDLSGATSRCCASSRPPTAPTTRTRSCRRSPGCPEKLSAGRPARGAGTAGGADPAACAGGRRQQSDRSRARRLSPGASCVAGNAVGAVSAAYAGELGPAARRAGALRLGVRVRHAGARRADTAGRRRSDRRRARCLAQLRRAGRQPAQWFAWAQVAAGALLPAALIAVVARRGPPPGRSPVSLLVPAVPTRWRWASWSARSS